jgi:hypothetical protein
MTAPSITLPGNVLPRKKAAEISAMRLSSFEINTPFPATVIIASTTDYPDVAPTVTAVSSNDLADDDEEVVDTAFFGTHIREAIRILRGR